MSEEITQEPPYYTLDTSLFQGIFRYFSRGREQVMVRGKIHESSEQYSLSKTEREIEPVSIAAGTRTYMHLKPYVQVPDIRLEVGLYPYPKQFKDHLPAIGEVTEAREQESMKEIGIGQAQAWSYPDGTLVIWECFLEGHFRDMPLLYDQNMKGLWTGFESFLTTHFPQATRLVTPFNDPLFELEEYQQFLRILGYEPVAKAAYGKAITQTT